MYVYYDDGDTSQWVDSAPQGGGNAFSAKIEVGNTKAEVTDTGSDGAFVVTTEGSERARVDNVGRMLLGTSSASATGIRCVLQGNSSGFADEPAIAIMAANTTTPTGGLGLVRFADSSHAYSAEIGCYRDGGTWTSGSSEPTRLTFFTTADGSSSPTERMRLNNVGSLRTYSSTTGIWSSTAAAAGTSIKTLICSHSSTGVGSGTQSFTVASNGDVQNTNNSYTAISDITLKENIALASSQWSDIKNIEVVNYNFKEETGHQTHKQLGVIAQQVETVSPGLVGTDADGVKSVNYSVLYMKSVKALQEAMERIETLETQNASLEARLTALEGGN
jgi:hypothetical protein